MDYTHKISIFSTDDDKPLDVGVPHSQIITPMYNTDQIHRSIEFGPHTQAGVTQVVQHYQALGIRQHWGGRGLTAALGSQPLVTDWCFHGAQVDSGKTQR